MLKELLEKAGGVLNLPKLDSKFFSYLSEQKQVAMLSLKNMDPEKLDQELTNMGMEILGIHDRHYPQRLKEISLPPELIYVKGKKEILSEEGLSVVGSRGMSSYGKAAGLKLLSPIAKKGVVTVSGLAMGIDTLAHEISVNNQTPTVAVLGCGLDRESIYPRNNIGLAQKILTGGGCLVSEYPPLSKPLKHHFIARNRIIARLSRAVLVIEAGKKSGALITANFALEENRDVLAVPGPITNSNSEGTNELIKNGAKPISQYQDILETLGIEETEEKKIELVGDERKLLELIQSGQNTIEEIFNNSVLDQQEILVLLTQLEIKQAIFKSPEGELLAL